LTGAAGVRPGPGSSPASDTLILDEDGLYDPAQGYFYCQTAPEPKKHAVLSSPWREYTFIDVLFLKLLGYDGPYLDWRGSGGPTLHLTVTLDHWTA
jgi:hypothetical protein